MTAVVPAAVDGLTLSMTEREWITVGRRLKASRQQRIILRLMIDEKLSAKQIAHRLGVTLKCVTKQIDRLYAKIGVHGRIGMVKRVYAERDRVRAENGQ